MSTSSVSAASFTGSSSFSAQLQQVISNAVNMASAPLQQLQTQQTNLTGQQSELNTLIGDFQSLQTSVDSISSVTGQGSYSASVSNQTVASAILSSGALAGTYSLDVSSIGSQTNTISTNGLTVVTDPTSGNIDSGSNYALNVNGKNYTLTDSSGSLEGLAQAINQSGAQVQATVVNVGSSSSPDYRLSVQSLDYAPDTIQLSDGTNNLLSTLSTGTNVTYQVNGQPSTPISANSRNITLSPGLSVQVLATGSTNVTVSQSASGVENALTSFASAYNTVVNELAKNRGQNGGVLSGQSTVYELQGALANLISYSGGSGTVTSLANLGLTFDENGNLQFDSSTFENAAATSTSDVLNFLGSETGGGFLQAATNLVTSAADPTNGTLSQTSATIGSELTDVGTKISDDQSQVTQLQQTLTNQMASADATISSLEQQVTEVSTLFTDMQQNARSISG